MAWDLTHVKDAIRVEDDYTDSLLGVHMQTAQGLVGKYLGRPDWPTTLTGDDLALATGIATLFVLDLYELNELDLTRLEALSDLRQLVVDSP